MATALITGASQGIGACIAKRLAKDGYNIAINHFPSDSDKANAEKVAEECRSFGVEAELFAANVPIPHGKSAEIRRQYLEYAFRRKQVMI